MKYGIFCEEDIMKIPAVKLAIIDNSIDAFVYTPIAHWKSFLEIPFDAFLAKKSRFPDLKKDYTHLIFTGSEASILDREPWVYEEAEVIQEAAQNGISILGSCYGHQLVALALCGPAHVRRCPQPEVGWIPIKVLKKNSLLGGEKAFYSFSIHHDEVLNLGNDFLILAATEACPIQAFKLRRRPIWGLQFHPEIDVGAARNLLRKLLGLNLPTYPFYERAMAETPRDSGLIRRIIRNFLWKKSTH